MSLEYLLMNYFMKILISTFMRIIKDYKKKSFVLFIFIKKF